MIINFINKDKNSYIFSCSVLLFILFYFAYPRSYNIGFALLALPSFIVLFKKDKYRISSNVQKLMAVYIIYFSIIAISVYFDSHKLKDIDIASRYLVSCIILIAILKYPIKKEFFFYGIAVSSILSFSVSSYDVFILRIRGFSEQMPIQAGDASMFFGLCSLIIYCYYLGRKRNIAYFFLISSMTGILASLFSSSRGGWVFSPFLLMTILYFYRHNFAKKLYILALSFAILGLVALTFLFNSKLSNDINVAVSQTQSYFNDKSSDEDLTEQSVGTRLELWKSAIYSFIDKPIFGWGKNGINESRKIQLENVLISQKFYEFATYNSLHAHNEYLNELSIRGIIGLLSLLLLLGYPGYYFYKHVRKPKTDEQFAFALSGLIFSLSISGFCLTQVYIGAHNSGAILMSTMTVILFSLVENEN